VNGIDVGFDGKVILKWTFNKHGVSVDSITSKQVQWQAFGNTSMNIMVP
jgi:hypothetical protein